MATNAKISGNVLTYLPRTMDRYFGEVASQTFAGRVTCFCTRSGIGGLNIQADLTRRFESSEANDQHGLTEEDYREIIARDRVLRVIDEEKARRLVNAMAGLVDDLLDRADPKYVFSLIVDHYMLDLLARFAQRRGVQLCMTCPGVTANTTLVTAYGEYNHVRDPGDSEVDAAVDQLSNPQAHVVYASPPKRYTLRRHLSHAARWWANYACFSVLGRCRGDELNYRYLCATNPRIYPESRWNGYRCAHYFHVDWSARLSAAQRPTLFIPLGFTPEATTDYWLRDVRFVNYEQFILRAASELSSSFVIVVKEHWAAAGKRPWEFYRDLSAMEGVVIAPPEVKSRQIMQRVEHVLVGAGTAGIEAALCGLKVATLDRPYYYLDGAYLDLQSADRISELPQLFAKFAIPSDGRCAQRRIARRMLEATFPGSLLPPHINTTENVARASASLREYLNTHGSDVRGVQKSMASANNKCFAPETARSRRERCVMVPLLQATG